MSGESIELYQCPPVWVWRCDICSLIQPPNLLQFGRELLARQFPPDAARCIIHCFNLSESDLMLPMGTIVTACMLVGLVVAAPIALIEKLPLLLRKACACVVLAAGLWNVLWYGLQHLTEFWGIAALISGVLMITTAGYVLVPSRLPAWIQRLRPVILFLLLGCAMLYAITIARL